MVECYILKNRIPVAATLEEWARMMEEPESGVIDKAEFDGIFVSTVFLGLNHSFGLGPPVLFETMIFGGQHDGAMERYSTYSEAEAGHAKMVALAKGGS